MSEPLDPESVVVVVGASLAGLRAAEEVRHLGHAGPVVIVGEEAHPPYDRPPLSKQVLSGAWEPSRIHHHTPDHLDTLGLELRLGRRATALDSAARTLTLDDGHHLAYDGLVVATGAAARSLPGTDGLGGVHTLRTLDDCLAVRSELAAAGDGARLVVVGGGFIGAEVAATCRGMGAEVALVEVLPTPMGRVLGEEMGSAVTGLHEANGVAVHAGVGVDRIERGGGPCPLTVHLADGVALPADVVVVGIGVVPGTGWLDGSGLSVGDGVLCDEHLFAADRVVAAGDLARWPHPVTGGDVRLEHWTNAAESGAAAGHNLVAGTDGAVPYVPVPFFWSDQFSTKIQMIGVPSADDEVVVVEGSAADGRLVALYRRGDRLGGVLALSRPRHLMAYRPLMAAGASFDEALALDVS